MTNYAGKMVSGPPFQDPLTIELPADGRKSCQFDSWKQVHLLFRYKMAANNTVTEF